jgi:hypothetical protein
MLIKKGSTGAEVTKIQEKLKAEGLYDGQVDGDFGKMTESAVKGFQANMGLDADGVVGLVTWGALFECPRLINKCLMLTGSFETGEGIPQCFAGLSGDFDGQGLSLGVLQWNFGQGSLQPLLNEMITHHSEIVQSIFQSKYDPLLEALNSDKTQLMAFVRSIQHPVKHYLFEPWKGMFKALGITDEFRNIQVKYAQTVFYLALELCSNYELRSERAVTLMFDIKVQNGGIKRKVKTQILNEFEGLPQSTVWEENELQKMIIIANCCAESSVAKWIEDVRRRKLCCANGTGIVHGANYDLEAKFGIRLRNIA